MRKKFNFDEELEKLDEDELSTTQTERARILVTVIPFVLIIIIFAVSLLVGSLKSNDQNDKNQDLQESIKEYADTGLVDKNDEAVETTEADKTEEHQGGSESESEVKEEREETEDESEKPEATPTPYKEIMQPEKKDYSQISFNKEQQLQEMMSYWADNNQKALNDLANLDRFKAMSYKLSGTKEFYYYGETDAAGKPHGTGIAVYADNQYYYGGWENGMRNGNGTWMHYHIHETPSKTDLYTYHQYTGSWKNDLPDGEGSEHYELNMAILKENTGYNNNLIGSYLGGLVHGEFYITNIYSDEEVFEWYATAENGSWVYRSENRDSEGRGPVQVENKNPDNYIWMHPSDNKNIGVSCLISSQKN